MSWLMFQELLEKGLGACFAVHNGLGSGLLESAYEGALVIELLAVFPLFYRGELAGEYVANLVVEASIIVELKAVKMLTSVMDAQVITYLRVSGVPVTVYSTKILS